MFVSFSFSLHSSVFINSCHRINNNALCIMNENRISMAEACVAGRGRTFHDDVISKACDLKSDSLTQLKPQYRASV